MIKMLVSQSGCLSSNSRQEPGNTMSLALWRCYTNVHLYTACPPPEGKRSLTFQILPGVPFNDINMRVFKWNGDFFSLWKKTTNFKNRKLHLFFNKITCYVYAPVLLIPEKFWFKKICQYALTIVGQPAFLCQVCLSWELSLECGDVCCWELSLACSDFCARREIKSRVAMASLAMTSLNPIWTRKIRFPVTMKQCKSFIISTILYGYESLK